MASTHCGRRSRGRRQVGGPGKPVTGHSISTGRQISLPDSASSGVRTSPASQTSSASIVSSSRTVVHNRGAANQREQACLLIARQRDRERHPTPCAALCRRAPQRCNTGCLNPGGRRGTHQLTAGPPDTRADTSIGQPDFHGRHDHRHSNHHPSQPRYPRGFRRPLRAALSIPHRGSL